MPTHTILTAPASGTVVQPRTYTDDQQAQISALREYAHSLLLPEDDSYYKWELRWLNKPDTIPRYMRAAKWKLDDGKKRIKGTLEWRREYKPDLIPPDEVRPEAETGKIIINGFDRDGRPIIHMRPDRENTEHTPRQLRHLVWCLERTKDLMPPGVESCVILIDYSKTTLRTNPSISVARKVLHILQNHYVETLGRGVVVNLPMLLNFFYKGISPFLDPVTRDKIKFNPNLPDLIPNEHLYKEFGGEFDYEFDFDSYWDQVCSACKIAPDGTRTESEAPPAAEKSHVPGDSTPATLVADSDSSPLTKEVEVVSEASPAEQTAPVS